jgi:uncharacterized protein
MGVIKRFAEFEPKPGSDFRQVLAVDPQQRIPMRALTLGMGGALLGVFVYVWMVSGLSTLVGMVNSGTLAKMSAGTIAAALAIPLSMALVLFVHRFRPGWVCSVQAGLRWRYLIAAWLVAVVILVGGWLITRIGQPWVWQPEDQLWAYLAVVIFLTPLQAAGEEFFFRGYLIQALHSAVPSFGEPPTGGVKVWLIGQYQKWFGVVGSAFVFALLHGTQNPPLFLHRFGFGLVTGWLAVKTGGLEAGIAAHVVNNVVTYGFAILTGTLVAARTVTEAGWREVGVFLASFVVYALIAAWVARRMNLPDRTA